MGRDETLEHQVGDTIMSITREQLRQLVINEMKEQQAAIVADEEDLQKIEKTTGEEEQVTTQDLRNKIINAAKEVSGIVKNEMDIVNFALQIIDAAKDKNLNSGILRQKLELVRDEMEKLR